MSHHATSALTDELLTVADIAGIVGAHEQTVRSWIRSGELKAARFGTRMGYRIRLQDYEEFYARRTMTGAISRLLLLGALPADQPDL
jgi:excisionase family DNA binding protein